jgi:hypothetical protein
MARATVQQELHFKVKNETGILGQITIALAQKGVYIIHMSAFTVKQRGYFQIITRDNETAKKVLKDFSRQMEERDVMVVEFENKVGTLAPVAKLLGSNGIEIHSAYGTSGDGFKIIGVFSTANNVKAAALINKASGSLGLG